MFGTIWAIAALTTLHGWCASSAARSGGGRLAGMTDEQTDPSPAAAGSVPAPRPPASAPAGGTDDDLSQEQVAAALERTARIIKCFTLSALLAIVVLLGIAFYRLNDTQAAILSMRWFVLAIIAIAGTVALGGVFIKMKRGIRQQNLRAVGILLVLLLASMLAVVSNNYEPVYGLLGGVAGYLFGKDESARGEDPNG